MSRYKLKDSIIWLLFPTHRKGIIGREITVNHLRCRLRVKNACLISLYTHAAFLRTVYNSGVSPKLMGGRDSPGHPSAHVLMN